MAKKKSIHNQEVHHFLVVTALVVGVALVILAAAHAYRMNTGSFDAGVASVSTYSDP